MALLLTRLFHCFQLPLYTASPRGTRPGKVQPSLSDFATQDSKIRLRPCTAAREWVVMTPYFKNCAGCLCLFSERIVAEADKKLCLQRKFKQIRKSVLTTFEALFMQNAKQIIVEKVAKTASKHQFRGGFGRGGQNRYFQLKPCSQKYHPTALLGRAAFAAYKRFGRRPKPWRRRNSLPPSIWITGGWSRPPGGGTQKERHAKSVSFFLANDSNCDTNEPLLGVRGFILLKGGSQKKALLVTEYTDCSA